MATPIPRFSFSGWTSQRISPQVNPATVPVPTPTPTAPGQLVAQTNAANTNLPAWLQAEVDKLNAQQALRTQMTGQVTGQPTQNVGDLMQGAAAQTRAAALFNQQVFGMNEAANLRNLMDQRARLQPTGAFGFNNQFDIPRQLNLDRQIESYQRTNVPLAASTLSGWVNPYRTF